MDDVAEAIAKVLIEIAWKGPGYLILRLIRPHRKTDFDGCLVIVVGTVFWLAVAVAVWGLVVFLSA